MNRRFGISIKDGSGVSLRSIERRDLECLRRWKNDNRHAFFYKGIISPSGQKKWFKRYLEDPGDFMFIVEYEGMPAGCLGFKVSGRAAEVYNVISAGNGTRRKGVMSLALKAMLSYITGSLALEAELKVLRSNLPAVNFYKKNSFVQKEESGEHLLMKLSGFIPASIELSRKVLYITYDGLTDPLGRSQITPYLNSLCEFGVRFTVVSFEKGGGGSGISAGIKNVRLKYHKNPPVISTAFDIACGAMAAVSQARSQGIGIVHARGYVAAAIALVVKKACGANFIFDMRGFWADERAEAGLWRKGGALYRIAKRFERAFFENADHVISLTEAGKSAISGFSYAGRVKAPVTVIPTCVDLSRFVPAEAGPGPGKMRLVYSGSLSTWYMPDAVLGFASFVNARGRLKELKVLTMEKEYAQGLFAKKGAGFVKIDSADYRDMPKLLAHSDAGLAFYRQGFSRKGCCPTKMGEYLACGIPVVVTAGVGDSDAILRSEGVGVVLGGFSTDSYASALKELDKLLAEGGALRERCRRAAEKHFSLEEGVKRLMRIYEELA